MDTLEVTRAPEHGIQKLGVDRQKELAMLFAGDLLEGLEIARSPMFDAWITAERRRFRGIQTVLLENLSRGLPWDSASTFVEEWLRLSPFDRSAHELMLTALARHGRIAEGEAHLASTTKLFESDGLESAPLRELWRQAREAHAAALGDKPEAIDYNNFCWELAVARTNLDRALDAALAIRPKAAASLFVRGIARNRKCGCKDGDEDIATARRLHPRVDEQFAVAGLSP